MAMYEPIRGRDEEEEEKKKRGVECFSGDVVVDDVEMAVHSRSSASGTSKIEDEGSKQRRLHQHQHQHQPPPKPQSQRLVSLDVFRGLTVAVIYSFLFFVFDFSFVC